MDFKTIQNLNNNLDNLNIILEFISKTVTQSEYEGAILKYITICNMNQIYETSIKEGELLIEKFASFSPSNYRTDILSLLIEAAININDLELAKKYLNNRHELLPIMNQYLTLVDSLKITKKADEDPIEILEKLYNEVLPTNLKIYVNEEMLNYYLNNNLITKAHEKALELIDDTLDQKYELTIVEILYLQQQYTDVVNQSIRLIEANIINVKLITNYISALTKLNKYRNAATIEAEYEQFIDKSNNDEEKLEAYEVITNLYEQMDNKFSLDIYNKKIRNIKRKKVNTKVDEVIKVEQVEEIKEKVKVKEIVTTKIVSNIKYLEHFERVRNWLIFSHSIDLKLQFREYLRTLFIEISKEVSFSEAIIYLGNTSNESNFFNYKKERLYDKVIINEYIDSSIVRQTIENKENIFGTPLSLNSKKDVLTQNKFSDDVKFIYSFYLGNNNSLTFYLDEDVNDPALLYELFIGIKVIIETRLIDELNVNTLKQQGNNLDKIINNNIMPVRILTEYNSNYNDVATKLFNIESKLHLELFLRDLPLNEAKTYEEEITRLFKYPNEAKILEYTYQDLKIKEYIYGMKLDNKISLVSFFVDESNLVKTKDNYHLKSITDNETKLGNKNALNDQMSSYLNDKTTFVLVELNNDLKDVYGIEKLNEFFIELALSTKKHFGTFDIYRVGYNQLLVIFNFNDIRTVDKEIKNYLQVVEHLQSRVLKYEKFNIKIGVLRYPVVTVEKNTVKLFDYLNVALQKAKQSKELNYVHFIYADYEKEVYEQEIIDYLNTAIQTNELSLRFKQIIDLENNIVWNYEAESYLPNVNINNKYLYIIARKRNKIIDLEHYLIKEVCRFLKQLYVETNHFISLTIPISKETFLDSKFDSFVIQMLKQYQIPSQFIRIICDLDIKNQSNVLKVNKILKSGISLDTTYIESSLLENFNAVHLDVKVMDTKWKKYYKNINNFLNEMGTALILKNINTKELRETAKSLGIKYISGDIYQKINPLDIINKIKEQISE